MVQIKRTRFYILLALAHCAFPANATCGIGNEYESADEEYIEANTVDENSDNGGSDTDPHNTIDLILALSEQLKEPRRSKREVDNEETNEVSTTDLSGTQEFSTIQPLMAEERKLVETIQILLDPNYYEHLEPLQYENMMHKTIAEIQAKHSKDIQDVPTLNFTDEEAERRRTGEIYLPKDYSKYEIPKIKYGRTSLAVLTSIALSIHSVHQIDEENEAVLLDMDLRVTWLDGRIFKIENLHLAVDLPDLQQMPAAFIDKIWKPDIYLDNLLKVEKLRFMEPPVAIALSNLTGVLIYRERLVVRVKCGIDFTYYPADTQVCQFGLQSYSYGLQNLILIWNKVTPGVYLREPSDFNFDLRLDNLEQVTGPDPIQISLKKPVNKRYGRLQFKLYARRKLSYHLIQTYIPSVFFIVITWLCFLLPCKLVEARLGISMTTLLTLTAMFSSVRDSTPNVSYAKAIDLWMVVCILFIFLTLVEFAVMAWICHLEKKTEASSKQNCKGGEPENYVVVPAEPTADNDLNLRRPKIFSTEVSMERRLSDVSVDLITVAKYKMWATLVERFAILFYALSFVTFTAVYCIWLLNAAKYFKWDVNPKFNKVDN